MRIAVFGTGGVGGYFGGRLAQAGEDVVFIARGEHLRALRTHGLKVESLKGDFLVQPAQAAEDPAEGVRQGLGAAAPPAAGIEPVPTCRFMHRWAHVLFFGVHLGPLGSGWPDLLNRRPRITSV